MSSQTKFILVFISLLPVGLLAQIDLFVAEYTADMRQTAADKIVPFGFSTDYRYGGNYLAFASIITSGETITGATLTGPSYPSGLALEYLPFDDEYAIEGDVRTLEEMTAIVSPGVYTFSGTGDSVGAFSENVTFPAYSPLSPLKITNFNQLQAIDISQPVTIEWEEFTEGQGAGISGGFAGLINIEITGYSQSDVEDTWDSESIHPNDAFGLLPTRTSVEIPAGTFKNGYTYVVNMFFARIDEATAAAAVEDALLVSITGYELEFNIHPQGQSEYWAGYPRSVEGFVNANFWIGELFTPLAPWVWSGKMDDWFFVNEQVASADGGWVFMPELAEGTDSLGLTMVSGTDYGYSRVLERWLYVLPGGLNAGFGWVNMY